MSKEPAYRPEICNICHQPLPIATTGRPRKTCSDRCRQIRRRRYDYEGWRYPRSHAKEWRAADRALRKMEQQYGQRIPDTPPVYVDMYTPRISDRERLLIRLSRGMTIPQCAICLKPYFNELSPDGIHCSGECRQEANRRSEALKRGIKKWDRQYDLRVDVRLDLGLPIKTCQYCEKPFPPYDKRKKYCNAKCRKAKWLSLREKCANCGEFFLRDPNHTNKKYCGKECNRIGTNKRRRPENPPATPRLCVVCGEMFTPVYRWKHYRTTCSERCYNKEYNRTHPKNLTP